MSLTLHFREQGKGTPVIILHGLFGSATNWQTMARHLSGQYRVVTPDLRNHGKSGHADSMDYPEMAHDVLDLMDKLEFQSGVLIGHSMGGKVAMQFALEQPERVDKLVILDISPVHYTHRYGKIFDAMKNLPLENVKNRSDIEARFCPLIGNRMLCQFLLQNLVRGDNGYYWRIHLEALENNMESIADFPGTNAVYTGPGLFLGGKLSEFIRTEHLPVIRKWFPAADVQWIENAGHMLHVEQPQALLDEILKFLCAD